MPDNRNVRQYLQLLKSAGVTHLPTVTLRAPETSAFRKSARAGQRTPATAQAEVPAKKSTTRTRAPSKAVQQPEVSADTNVILQQSFEDASAKARGLQELSEVVSACRRCSELAETRRQTVFGVGNPDADIMFIGEAPGADEDRQGEPFVGAAGQLMDKIIAACGWRREDLYICNILRCRPPGNRNPLPQEAANCREYLDGQIQIVQPKYIVCWGTVAAQNVLNETRSVGRMRGEFLRHGEAKVLCTYHPSYLLRNASAKKLVWEDMQLFMAEIEKEAT